MIGAPRGEVVLALFEDLLTHAVRMTDDAECAERPICGKEVAEMTVTNEQADMCVECIPLLCKELGLNADEFMGEVAAEVLSTEKE